MSVEGGDHETDAVRIRKELDVGTDPSARWLSFSLLLLNSAPAGGDSSRLFAKVEVNFRPLECHSVVYRVRNRKSQPHRNLRIPHLTQFTRFQGNFDPSWHTSHDLPCPTLPTPQKRSSRFAEVSRSANLQFLPRSELLPVRQGDALVRGDPQSEELEIEQRLLPVPHGGVFLAGDDAPRSVGLDKLREPEVEVHEQWQAECFTYRQ